MRFKDIYEADDFVTEHPHMIKDNGVLQEVGLRPGILTWNEEEGKWNPLEDGFTLFLMRPNGIRRIIGQGKTLHEAYENLAEKLIADYGDYDFTPVEYVNIYKEG